MRFVRSLGVLGMCLSLPLLAPPAIAKPVGRADISGKKICWSSGAEETYSASGKLSSTASGPGTWEFIADGTIAVITQQGNWSWAMQKQADGTFTEDTAVSNGLPNSFHYTGHYCK